VGGDVRVHALEMLEPPREGMVACPLPPGGATFHSSRTWHYTGANRSEVDRRAYILSGGRDARPRGDGRRFVWNEMKQTARQERADRGNHK
ncbi:MAG: phytanoyl-CoA dioxygenase family protein, partial [Armatimonadota bacterium]